MPQIPGYLKPQRFRAWLLATATSFLFLLFLVFYFLPVAPIDTEPEPGTNPAASSRQTLSRWIRPLAARQANPSSETEIPWRLLTYPPPPCRSHGFVRWEDGSPAAGAEIISLETPTHRANENTWVHTGHSTDEEGHYELPHQESCSVRLGAVIPGKGRGEEPAAPVGDDEESPYMIRRDIVLDDAVRLHGVVVDEHDEPVPGAGVCATLSWTLDTEKVIELESPEATEVASRMWANATSTDPAGAFDFPAMEPGDWTIVVEADDLDRGHFEIKLDPVEPPDPQKWILSHDTCWHVIVQDVRGLPIEGATVEIRQVNNTCSRQSSSLASLTGSDGVVEECLADPEHASIMALAPWKTRGYFRNENGLTEFVVKLHDAGAITGRLSPYSPGDCPCFTAALGARAHTFKVEEDGTFLVTHLAEGTNRGSIHTDTASWLGPWPGVVKKGEILDLGVVELELNRVPPEVANARPSWLPFGR